ncbi:MAG: [Fe-Fe] hydrogenase large subunit C-terminal domain-containing protein [Sporomusaceae bacterium]|nr:[Fe-Fe] hydrogenase large subunit C-terminal domain-containing protein [Sporomusaceae bacterium]
MGKDGECAVNEITGTPAIHSVRLLANRCKGCVSCTKRCPTEAIRIRFGKARIIHSRCIDCGECIRHCPTHAKTAITDGLNALADYDYNIALPSPALYGQFGMEFSHEAILWGLKQLGFQEVVEVAEGVEIAALAIADYLQQQGKKQPAISSVCPAVIRLIQVKYPELVSHIVPIDAPEEILARKLRHERSDKGRVGIWFITPCPAKMTAVSNPLGRDKSELSGTISILKIYGELLKILPAYSQQEFSQISSWIGVGYESAGGEGIAGKVDSLLVHDIHSVINVLDQVAIGKLNDVAYLECLACVGGCLGGPLTVENRYVAKHRLKQRLKLCCEEDQKAGKKGRSTYDQDEIDVKSRKPILPLDVMKLDEDIFKAMHKVEMIDQISSRLPGLDCGSCGSPTCRALAEDIAQGSASEADCVFKLRKRVKELAQEMIGLAEKMPSSLGKKNLE